MKKKLAFIIISSIIYGIVFINLINFEYFHFITTILMIIVLLYFFIKEFRIYTNLFILYMFNIESKNYDKNIQRPRLFINLIFGCICAVVIYKFAYFEGNINIYVKIKYLILLLCFSTSASFLYFVCHKDHLKNFILNDNKKILEREDIFKEEIISENEDINIGNKWNRKQLESIYNNLFVNDFINTLDKESNKFDYQLFAELLLTVEYPSKPKFILNMDNIQTWYFWNLLNTKNKNFTLENFLKIFKNKNDNATKDSIVVSYSKSKSGPKRKDEIDKCFIFQ